MQKYLNRENVEIILGIVLVTFLIQFARLLVHSPYKIL
jgi:hypothetical protein